MEAKSIANNIKFDNNYPSIDSLGLFSKRHEINFVLQDTAKKLLISKILKFFPNSKVKYEIIATTYFDQSLVFEPQKTCTIRFRQRQLLNKLINIPHHKYWHFFGPGSFEVKIRKINSQNMATKMGTFLTDKKGQNIYSLMHLARQPQSNANLIEFINLANSKQQKGYHVTPQIITAVKDSLRPYATRVNLRQSFEINDIQKTRITLETKPLFYIYPIDYHYPKKYIGYLTEKPNRCKVEIKSSSKTIVNKFVKNIGDTIKKYGIPKNKYTQEPYYKMVLDVSKQVGTVVDEFPGQEIEAKANLVNKVNLFDLITKIRNKLIKGNSSQYRLFPTDPQIKTRGEAEKNRIIIGWQDKNKKWHEVVTIIRLTKNGTKEYGYCAILKWKSDSQIKLKNVLSRKQEYIYLKNNISNKQLIDKASHHVDKKLTVVGVAKKMKYRIFVQYKNGRNFCVSLDETKNLITNNSLQQLEIEYLHTVISANKHLKTETIQTTCNNCLEYFINLISNLNIKIEKTNLRKIDFLGTLII